MHALTKKGSEQFLRYKNAYEIAGEWVHDPEHIAPALERAFAERRPYVLDVQIDPLDAGFGREPIPVKQNGEEESRWR